jgi:hypothetical protein
MAASRFSSAVTVEDWATELTAILGDVERAVEGGTFEKRLELQDLLFEFVKASPTSAEALDAIARRAAGDLLKAEVEDAVAGIAARNAELKEATRLIRQGTAEAKGAAKALQFEKVAESLESARAGIEALTALRDGLTDEDAELTDRLIEIAGAIEDFQKAAGQTVGKTRSIEPPAESRPATRGVLEEGPPKGATGKTPAKPRVAVRKKSATGAKRKSATGAKKKAAAKAAPRGKKKTGSSGKKTRAAAAGKRTRSTGKRKPPKRSSGSSG